MAVQASLCSTVDCACGNNFRTFTIITNDSLYLSVTLFFAHVSGEVEAESEDDDDDDDDCKKGSMDEVCISQVTQFKYNK